METSNKQLKRLFAHLLGLDLHRFLISRTFYLFTIENDIDSAWNTLVDNSLTQFSKEQQTLYYGEPLGLLSVESLPGSWIDSLFNELLKTLFSNCKWFNVTPFPQIISTFLASYLKWPENYPDNSHALVNDELIKTISLDLFDLGFDEEDVFMYFELSGFDLSKIFNLKDSASSGVPSHEQNPSPMAIHESLEKFREDYPDPCGVAFIIMQFGKTKEHDDILKSIKKTLEVYDISGIRADDKLYHDDNFYNILTYLHGCSFGIAVFEKISRRPFNPNVSFEAGYLFALKKPVCLLKEKSLRKIPSDLVGKLYQEFDIGDCEITVDTALTSWLFDKRLCPPLTINKSNISPEFYEQMENYLLQEGFKKLGINKKMIYDEAQEIVSSKFEKFDEQFLNNMVHVGFSTPDIKLTKIGGQFVRKSLSDFLLNSL